MLIDNANKQFWTKHGHFCCKHLIFFETNRLTSGADIPAYFLTCKRGIFIIFLICSTTSQTAKSPRRSELNLLVPHSLACNPIFGGVVRYPCIQRAGSTRQHCARLCSMVTRRGLYEQPRKGCWRSLKYYEFQPNNEILQWRTPDCLFFQFFVVNSKMRQLPMNYWFEKLCTRTQKLPLSAQLRHVTTKPQFSTHMMYLKY